MHLNKLIELFAKNVSMYSNPIERAVLEHLRRLKTLEEKRDDYHVEPKAQVAPIKEYAIELGLSYMAILSRLRSDEDAPHPISGETTRNQALLYYDRDEFYAWWNNRKKK